MDLKESLEQIGISDRESRVYLALLDLGPTTSSAIIRKTGIASSKIYDVLEKLEQKGLVTHVLVKSKKEFHAVNPTKLSEVIKEKEQIIADILPRLKELYGQTREETQAEIYKGKEGMKKIFEEILDEAKEWFALGASGKAEITLEYYMPGFYKRMKEKKIKLNVLFVDTEETRKQAKRLKDFENIKSRFLPKEIKNLMAIFIYGDKIVVIPITPTIEISPIAILIKSKESAESYRDYFNWLWRLSKP